MHFEIQQFRRYKINNFQAFNNLQNEYTIVKTFKHMFQVIHMHTQNFDKHISICKQKVFYNIFMLQVYAACLENQF